MLGSSILLFVMLSGDFCAVTLLDREFGEVTPICVLAYGFIVYFSGFFKSLGIGVAIVTSIVIAIYAISICICMKKRNLVCRLRKFCGVPFFLFLGSFLVFLYCDYGQLVTGTDDPGHWMDCVKVMTYSNEFYANPVTQSTFPTYPPMMAMIQLLIQKQYLTFFEGDFCEWLMFLTYHMVTLSLFFPFISIINGNLSESKSVVVRVWIVFILISTIFLVITVFFRQFSSRVGIDPFLACEAAMLFLMILYKEKIATSYLFLLVLLAAITLTKDLGLLFAAFGVFYFIITSSKNHQFNLSVIVPPVAVVILSKVSWQLVIKYYNAIDPKPNKVDWVKYIFVLFGFSSYDETYKNDTIRLFRTAFFHRDITIGNGTRIQYYIFFLALVLMIIIQCIYVKEKNKVISCYFLSGLCFCFFIIGLGGVYVDRFIYTEAVKLASFERYTNTLFCMLLLEYVIIQFTDEDKSLLHGCASLLVLIVCLQGAPKDNIKAYLSRRLIVQEASERKETDCFSKQLIDNCKSGSNVYFLSQGDYGTQYIYVKFMIRPYLSLQSIAGDDYNWCFVDNADPNNIYFKEMHIKEFQQIVFDDSLRL